MARLPRLLVDGCVHLISLPAQHGQVMARDEADLQGLFVLLREAAAVQRVSLHAWSLRGAGLDLVASAAAGQSLSRMMQAVARRHAVVFNRRHGRRGSLWEGRFRAAVIEPGAWVLRCMVHVDLLGSSEPADAGNHGLSSLAAHVGRAREPLFQAPDAYWALGNTPFEREAVYRDLLLQGLGAADIQTIEVSLRGGWPLGSEPFAVALADVTGRPTRPRARGRPRRAAESTAEVNPSPIKQG